MPANFCLVTAALAMNAAQQPSAVNRSQRLCGSGTEAVGEVVGEEPIELEASVVR
jgi:hypothetical protein